MIADCKVLRRVGYPSKSGTISHKTWDNTFHLVHAPANLLAWTTVVLDMVFVRFVFTGAISCASTGRA